MGNKGCKGLMSDERVSRWHANKIVWDANEKRELPLIKGEAIQKTWEDVEDCVGGLKGTLQLTTLRLIWIVSTEAGNPPHTADTLKNVSIGFKTIQSVQFNVHESKYYGRTRTLTISTRWGDADYEFTFAMPAALVTEALHTIGAWQKRFKASRVFRETLIREMKMTKSSVGVILYYPEKHVQTIMDVDNVNASKKYNGKLILTTHRFIWVSAKSSVVNVSIPFMEMSMVATRSSPYGMGLLVAGINISVSQKTCHLRQAVKDGSDTIILAFKLPTIAQVQELNKFCIKRQKEIRENPIYMPSDGKVIHRMGRWMIVDEETWRQAMGLDEDDDDVEESAEDMPATHAQIIGGFPNIPMRLNTDAMENDIELQYDDPRTPHATPIDNFDLGADADLIDDLAMFGDDDNYTAPPGQGLVATASSAAVATGNAVRTDLQENVPPPARLRRRTSTGPDVPTSPAAAAYRVDHKCVICLNTSPQLAFDPCGHLCTCKKCGTPLKECPICRQTIGKALTVFVV